MKGKKLILHIGTEKTGTSTIQYQMSQNYDELLKQGVLYPKTFLDEYDNHVKLTCMTVFDNETEILCKVNGIPDEEAHQEFRKEIIREFECELESFTGHTVIISNEHLSSRLKNIEIIKSLKEYLNKYFDEIKIVVYIREQVEYLCSLYSTSIKNGEYEVFYSAKFLEEIYDIMDYDYLLNNWMSVFDKENFAVRVFDREFLKNGDIFEDFSDVCGLDVKSQEIFHLNETLNLKQVEFLRRVNKKIPFLINNMLNEKIIGLVPLIESINIKSPKIRDLVTEEYVEVYRESNEKVKNTFFKDKPYLFKPFKLSDNIVLDQRLLLTQDDITYLYNELITGEDGKFKEDLENIEDEVRREIEAHTFTFSFELRSEVNVADVYKDLSSVARKYSRSEIANVYLNKAIEIANKKTFKFLKMLISRRLLKIKKSTFDFEILLDDKVEWADVYRDTALVVEKYGELEVAYQLMLVALKYRPHGEFIRGKCGEYAIELNNINNKTK